MKVQKYWTLLLLWVAVLWPTALARLQTQPDTYWQGAGDTPGMADYQIQGRYLRFSQFPIRVVLVTTVRADWEEAFHHALAEINVVVPVAEGTNVAEADIIVFVLPARFMPVFSPCDISLTDGCAVIRPLGLPDGEQFRPLGLVWLEAESDLPHAHLMLHEMIHAMGLLVHSPFPTDVMYDGEDSAVLTLSPRDRATLELLYGQPTWAVKGDRRAN